MSEPLITREEWDKLTPFEQGLTLYLQQHLPGSELADTRCPYAPGSAEHRAFMAGEQRGVLIAQDSEE